MKKSDENFVANHIAIRYTEARKTRKEHFFMGLIKAISGATGGVLADQWKEYF